MRKVFLPLCAIFAALVIFAGIGCSNTIDGPDPAKGTKLTIAVTEQVSRSILPEVSMDPASYQITGTGPKGATFEQSTTGANVTVPGLAFGEWTVIVTAYNDDGIAIGQGSGTVTVVTNTTAYLMVTVRPFDGFGTLELGVTWPAEQVQTAAIESTLTPYSGSSRDLAFTVDGAAGTASFSADDVAAGYHTLVLKLLDNDFLAMGAVEVVRIVADQTTSGTIEFENVNSGRGSIEVGITPDMRDPLDVSITGAEEAKPKNQSQSLHASVSNYAGNVTYVWYVNATAVATGQDYTFDSSWDEGYYRIDVTAFTTDGTRAGSSSATVTVSEAVISTFTTVWQTSNPGESASNQICLPLENQGVYNFTVEWGDGSSNVITAWNAPEATHTYTTVGQYEVKITGVIKGFSFGTRSYRSSPYRYGDSLKLLEIKEWGPVNLGNQGRYFHYCSNLTISATDQLNLDGTINLQAFFKNCSALTDVPGMNSWDVSNVTNTANMFYRAIAFNQSIGDWDVSNVTNMTNMFYGATAFNQDIGNWNVSNVTNMCSMFMKATAFNQDIDNWDVSNVTNMEQMFDQASTFNGDIGNWDVSNVTNMHLMFFQASSFNQDIGNWDVSNVTNMGAMFKSTITFNQELGNWDVSNVANMDEMFKAAITFNQDLRNWDVSNVTNMGGMFAQAIAFNGDIGSWNVSNVTNMYSMFYYALSFNQDLRNWDVSNVTNMEQMFDQASIFNGDIGNWDVSNVTNMQRMFYRAIAFNGYIDNWDVSNVTNMMGMFAQATAFNGDIGSWDVFNVTNMDSMFCEITSFNGDIGNWDVSNVTTMAQMFYATAFNQDIGNWDVSSVTNMRDMFYEASNFNQDIGNWDVSKVTTMQSMLYNSNLSTANYTALLIGWSNLPSLQQNVQLNAGSAKYTFAASSARHKLIDDYGWTITDGGLAQ